MMMYLFYYDFAAEKSATKLSCVLEIYVVVFQNIK